MHKYGKPFYRLLLLFTVLTVVALSQDQRRPFYMMAHMVNSIKEVRKYLNQGANVIETDLQFYANGTIKHIHHGFPCDFGRRCDRKVKLPEYLKYIKEVTNPNTTDNYSDQLIMLFFDLKLRNVRKHAKGRAGLNLANEVLDQLWGADAGERRMKVMLCVERLEDYGFLTGFLDQFKKRGVENLLQYVGFDGGTGNVDEAGIQLNELGIKERIWMGDGITNFFTHFRSDKRLMYELIIRDTPSSYISKVYKWTIDSPCRMRRVLDLGVDGIMTNRPDILNAILQDDRYSSKFRLATPLDNPFTKFSLNETEVVSD